MPSAIINGYEVGGTSTMNTEHARLLQEGNRRMPRQGEVCDNSCFFSFACNNYSEGSLCKGFQICSNGKLDRHVRRNILEESEKTLSESDRLGIESYIRMFQQTSSPEIRRHLTPVILRYLKPPEEKKEKLRTMRGFTEYEINENGSLSLPEPKPETPKIPDPTPECLLALAKNTKPKQEEKT